MALSIPIHPIDQPMVYMCGDDTAWRRELSIDHTDPDHPLVRYFAGVTRYSLDDPGLQEYLDESDKPAAQFHLRRLSRYELADVRNQERMARPATAEIVALKYGLRRVENLDGCKFAGADLSPITEDQITALEGLIGPDRLLEIGKAVIRGTTPLSLAEKKRSAS